MYSVGIKEVSIFDDKDVEVATVNVIDKTIVLLRIIKQEEIDWDRLRATVTKVVKLIDSVNLESRDDT